MNIKEHNAGSISVLKRASSHLGSLRSEIALIYAQSQHQDQATTKAQQLALSKIQAIEREVKGSLEQYVKKNIESGNTFMNNPFKQRTDNKVAVQSFVVGFIDQGYVDNQRRNMRPEHQETVGLRNLEKFKQNQKNKDILSNVLAKKESKNLKESKGAGTPTAALNPHENKPQYRIKKETFKSKPVPASIRKDPFAEIPVLTLGDLNKGLYTLLNQGYLGKNVDITQALQRNNPLITSKRIEPNTVLFNDSILELNINEKRLFVEPATRSHSKNVSHLSYPSVGMNQSPKDLSQSRADEAPAEVSPMITVPKPTNSVKPTPLPTSRTEEETDNKTERLKNPDFHIKKINQKFVEVVNGTVKKDAEYLRIRSLNLMNWGNIEEVMGKVVEFAAGHRILTFRIFVDRLKKLSLLMRQPTENELIPCIENYHKMRDFLKNLFIKTEQSSREQDLMILVAVKIQKNFRKMMAKRIITKLADIQKKIKMVQFHLRLKYIHKATVARTRERNFERYKEFMEINARFTEQWDTIADQERVEVHINSLSTLD